MANSEVIGKTDEKFGNIEDGRILSEDEEDAPRVVIRYVQNVCHVCKEKYVENEGYDSGSEGVKYVMANAATIEESKSMKTEAIEDSNSKKTEVIEEAKRNKVDAIEESKSKKVETKKSKENKKKEDKEKEKEAKKREKEEKKREKEAKKKEKEEKKKEKKAKKQDREEKKGVKSKDKGEEKSNKDEDDKGEVEKCVEHRERDKVVKSKLTKQQSDAIEESQQKVHEKQNMVLVQEEDKVQVKKAKRTEKSDSTKSAQNIAAVAGGVVASGALVSGVFAGSRSSEDEAEDQTNERSETKNHAVVNETGKGYDETVNKVDRNEDTQKKYDSKDESEEDVRRNVDGRQSSRGSIHSTKRGENNVRLVEEREMKNLKHMRQDDGEEKGFSKDQETDDFNRPIETSTFSREGTGGESSKNTGTNSRQDSKSSLHSRGHNDDEDAYGSRNENNTQLGSKGSALLSSTSNTEDDQRKESREEDMKLSPQESKSTAKYDGVDGNGDEGRKEFRKSETHSRQESLSSIQSGGLHANKEDGGNRDEEQEKGGVDKIHSRQESRSSVYSKEHGDAGDEDRSTEKHKRQDSKSSIQSSNDIAVMKNNGQNHQGTGSTVYSHKSNHTNDEKVEGHRECSDDRGIDEGKDHLRRHSGSSTYSRNSTAKERGDESRNQVYNEENIMRTHTGRHNEEKEQENRSQGSRTSVHSREHDGGKDVKHTERQRRQDSKGSNHFISSTVKDDQEGTRNQDDEKEGNESSNREGEKSTVVPRTKKDWQRQDDATKHSHQGIEGSGYSNPHDDGGNDEYIKGQRRHDSESPKNSIRGMAMKEEDSSEDGEGSKGHKRQGSRDSTYSRSSTVKREVSDGVENQEIETQSKQQSRRGSATSTHSIRSSRKEQQSEELSSTDRRRRHASGNSVHPDEHSDKVTEEDGKGHKRQESQGSTHSSSSTVKANDDEEERYRNASVQSHSRQSSKGSVTARENDVDGNAVKDENIRTHSRQDSRNSTTSHGYTGDKKEATTESDEGSNVRRQHDSGRLVTGIKDDVENQPEKDKHESPIEKKETNTASSVSPKIGQETTKAERDGNDEGDRKITSSDVINQDTVVDDGLSGIESGTIGRIATRYIYHDIDKPRLVGNGIAEEDKHEPQLPNMSVTAEVQDYDALTQALGDVRNDGDGVDKKSWVLVGHVDNKPNQIQLVAQDTSGEATIEDFASRLVDDQVMYGFIRMSATVDMNTTVKFVYVHWLGENVPFVRKGRFGVVHGSIVEHFQPFHLQIETGNAEDLSEQEITQRLDESSLQANRILSSDNAEGRQHRGFTQHQLPRSTSGTMRSVAPASAAANISPDVNVAIGNIRDDGNGMTWVIGNFEDGDPRKQLIVHATGEGDVEELKENLLDDQVQYALYRTSDVIDGISTVKFAFIAWIGEQVKPMTKGKVSTVKGAIETAFSPFHIALYPANQSELDESGIKDKVMASSGSKSFVK